MKMINCCICGVEIDDAESNNPRPVKESGRCCHNCDNTQVQPVRRWRSSVGMNSHGDAPYRWSEERSQSYILNILKGKRNKKPLVVKKGV